MMTAIQPVEVSGADVDNLTIAVGGGITIPGRIQVEGTAPPAFGFDRIALALNPTSGVVTLGSVLQIARPASDGAFSLEKVNAGEYRFAIQGLPPAMYVKSARFDQTDILASGFTVTDRSPGTLQVVVSANSGQIRWERCGQGFQTRARHPDRADSGSQPRQARTLQVRTNRPEWPLHHEWHFTRRLQAFRLGRH